MLSRVFDDRLMGVVSRTKKAIAMLRVSTADHTLFKATSEHREICIPLNLYQTDHYRL